MRARVCEQQLGNDLTNHKLALRHLLSDGQDPEPRADEGSIEELEVGNLRNRAVHNVGAVGEGQRAQAFECFVGMDSEAGWHQARVGSRVLRQLQKLGVGGGCAVSGQKLSEQPQFGGEIVAQKIQAINCDIAFRAARIRRATTLERKIETGNGVLWGRGGGEKRRTRAFAPRRDM